MSLGSGGLNGSKASNANETKEESSLLPSRTEHGALLRALAAISEVEDAFTNRFYDLLFEDRPDVRPLFGAHSLSEQEEMMRETLSSLLALDGEQNWLDANLRALGKSHAEYGVTEDMYASFADVMLICAREVLGSSLNPEAESALAFGVRRVSEIMLEGAAQAELGEDLS